MFDGLTTTYISLPLVHAMAESQRQSKPPQDVVAEIGVDDLYDFLGVESTSSNKEITTGYRRKALKYHPDKNPDNPSASELFQKLSKAYHILTDPAAKAAYDKWLKAKFAAKKRHQELNAKRRRLKESLEMREGQSQKFQTSPDEILAAKQMQKEIGRLREESARKVKELEESLRQQFQNPASATATEEGEEEEDTVPSLKVTWKAKKGDPCNGGYSKESLEAIFSKFGVHHILVSKKKNGKAVVSFHTATDALQALESGCGLEENPLRMSWASGELPKPVPVKIKTSEVDPQSFERERDYESVTLMRLRQAEERKRLIEELNDND